MPILSPRRLALGSQPGRAVRGGKEGRRRMADEPRIRRTRLTLTDASTGKSGEIVEDVLEMPDGRTIRPRAIGFRPRRPRG
jgi:hypothetical protein